MGDYSSIIDMPHHVSKVHPQMPILERAAQFAPFDALTGFDESIDEAGRRTENRIELFESRKEEIDRVLQEIGHMINASALKDTAKDPLPRVSIKYFKPDARKSGGRYITAADTVIKIDSCERNIYMSDGTVIPIDDLLDAEILNKE
ncbi:MAG: hypothetical protein VZR00_05535 [Lachnospiraceae bacterium]|nr:hypothetical protein [Lachnospiraceae bacterium]MEE3461340.1 hypothetical protein [Lachnospiraceae bacterium]